MHAQCMYQYITTIVLKQYAPSYLSICATIRTHERPMLLVVGIFIVIGDTVHIGSIHKALHVGVTASFY
jgi:hypothetical protein